MADYAQIKRDALKMAREWARAGNKQMAQYYLDRAESVGYVSYQQVSGLNRILEKARGDRGEQVEWGPSRIERERHG